MILAAVAGLIAIGMAAGGVLTRSPSRDQGRASASIDASPAGTGPGADLPPGQDRTEPGARATAIAFATASQDWLYLNDEQIDRSVRSIATASAAPSLSAETVAELRTARDGLAKSTGRVWWLVRPLASRAGAVRPGDGSCRGVDGDDLVGGRRRPAAGRLDAGHGRPFVGGRRLAPPGHRRRARSDTDDRHEGPAMGTRAV